MTLRMAESRRVAARSCGVGRREVVSPQLFRLSSTGCVHATDRDVLKSTVPVVNNAGLYSEEFAKRIGHVLNVLITHQNDNK